MKVALYAESEADDAALQIFVEAILQRTVEPVPHFGSRIRGWPSMRNVLQHVLKHVYYQTDAEGFVLVVDSNGSRPHREEGAVNLQCRLCQLRRIRDATFDHLTPRPDRPHLRTAIGLAVPSIEAWLLCDRDHGISEASWVNAFDSGARPYSAAKLKTSLYGTDRPSLALEKQCMTEAARRLTQNLTHLEKSFPAGFGVFARELREWNAATTRHRGDS